MKIAFVEHMPVGSGLVRYATKLAASLLVVDSKIFIDYYTHHNNISTNKELYSFESKNIRIKILQTSIPSKKYFDFIKKHLKKSFKIKEKNFLHEELKKKLTGYDVIYFTTPHMSEFVPVKGNKFATFHDFNWKYLFGVPNFSKKNEELFEQEIPKWLNDTKPIVSSHFMESELQKFFPKKKCKTEIVYLPGMAENKSRESTALKKYNIIDPYIIYPANLYSHKNHLNLFSAFAEFKKNKKFENFKLVLSGMGTDYFNYAKATKTGLEKSKEDFDVIGLGYISNSDVDELIANAFMVISVSLYEAGSGPAIDAWNNCTPIIMSDIASHKDQLNFFKYKCVLFDPMNCKDIAEKMIYSADNIDSLKKDALEIKSKLNLYTWKDAAAQYLEIFKKK